MTHIHTNNDTATGRTTAADDAWESARMIQPAIELMTRTDWDMMPELLATALAMHLVLEQEAPRIHRLAQKILHEAETCAARMAAHPAKGRAA